MMTHRFAAEVRADPDGATRIVLHGELDLAADAVMAEASAGAASAGADRVVLDFSDVGYINSTGIALIVRLLAEARRDRRTVVAEGLTPHYREVFRITRLSDYVMIEEPAAGEEGAA